MSAAFLQAAASALGPRGLTSDPDLLQPWLTDWRGRYTGRALALASPASTEEVSQLVRLCAEHGVPIVPQGGNSGMSGGATPKDDGRSIILSLRRMNKISTVDSEGKRATCEAGVVLQSLHEAAEEAGMRFPLTLGGKGTATIGGLISTNAGGTQVLRHGTMRAQVLGIEAVMANGSVLDTLKPLKKDNRGFDFKQLLIGSEGTLGIITGATLALQPAIAARRVVFAGMDDIRDARRLLVLAEQRVGDALEGFEVMPRHALEAVMAYEPDARDPLETPHNWYALLEFVADENGRDTLEARVESVLEAAVKDKLIADATLAASEAQAEALWALRDGISSAERALGPAVQHDISVPPEDMADFIAQTGPELEARFPGTRAMAFGHLGDGNVHYHLRAPEGTSRSNWEEHEGKPISRAVHDLVRQWGGSISAEHGIGQLKREELARVGDPTSLAILRSVKQALDPLGILNPGKLVPLASEQREA